MLLQLLIKLRKPFRESEFDYCWSVIVCSIMSLLAATVLKGSTLRQISRLTCITSEKDCQLNRNLHIVSELV